MSYYSLQGRAIEPLGGGAPFATLVDANPLDPLAGFAPAQSQRVVSWSGWFGGSIFARDFRTWTRDAWGALDRWCDRILPLLAPGVRLCFRPHPRHILADPQSCLSFLKRRESQPIEVLLDPAGFLTASMLPRAEEHLLRALDSLAGHAAVPAIIISNAASIPGDDDLLQPASVDRGLLPASLMRLIASRCPAAKPGILLGPDPVSQATFLDAARSG